MLINLQDLSPVKKTVDVEVPADAVRSELNEVTTEFARHAKLPGFRPGKTPIGVIRKRFAKDIHEEVVQRLLPKFFHEAVSEKGLVTVGSAYLKRVDEIREGEPLRFEAEFEIKPEFELKEYKGIELKNRSTDVGPDDVDAMVERLRDQGSTMRPVEDRGAEDGDYVIMDVTTSGEGIETRTSEGAHVQIGEESPMPELHALLRGRKAGDDASLEKSWGEDAVNEEVRGKYVKYDIKVRELRIREKPEMNEEFAKSIGFESVEAMRARIEEDLKRHREHEALRAKREEAADKLVAAHQLDAPESLIEEELGNSLRNYARYLSSQGIDLERAGLDWEKVREDFRPEAEKRVKRGLILESIARQENLEVADAEVDSEIRKASDDAKKDFAEIKHRLRHDGGYEALRGTILQERALDFVVESAVLV